MAQHQSLNAPYGARCFLTTQASATLAWSVVAS